MVDDLSELRDVLKRKIWRSENRGLWLSFSDKRIIEIKLCCKLRNILPKRDGFHAGCILCRPLECLWEGKISDDHRSRACLIFCRIVAYAVWGFNDSRSLMRFDECRKWRAGRSPRCRLVSLVPYPWDEILPIHILLTLRCESTNDVRQDVCQRRFQKLEMLPNQGH